MKFSVVLSYRSQDYSAHESQNNDRVHSEDHSSEMPGLFSCHPPCFSF